MGIEVMSAIRIATLGLVALLAIGTAHTSSARTEGACFAFGEGQQVVLRGTIVQSAKTEEREGMPPHKFMAITLDDPICPTDEMDKKLTFFEVSPVPVKWLGHYVTITGNMVLRKVDGSWSVTAKRITDNGATGSVEPSAKAAVIEPYEKS